MFSVMKNMRSDCELLYHSSLMGRCSISSGANLRCGQEMFAPFGSICVDVRETVCVAACVSLTVA